MQLMASEPRKAPSVVLMEPVIPSPMLARIMITHPQRRSGRRPTSSVVQKEMVMPTKRITYMMTDDWNGSLIPAIWKKSAVSSVL